MDHRQLQKTIESFDTEKFEHAEQFLLHVLQQIIQHKGIDILGGRLWRLESAPAAYRLVAQLGALRHIRKDFVLTVAEYPPFLQLGTERTIVSNETNEYLRGRGITTYSATGVGEKVHAEGKRLYEYILTFNTNLAREEEAPALDIISMTVSRMLRSRRQELKSATLEKELEKARMIQQSILPEPELRFHHYDIYGISLPDRSVGGDFFDYVISSEKDRVDIVIGDAATKGIPAAVQALYASGALRMGAMHNIKVSTLVRNLNALVHQAFPDESFLTLVLAELTDDSQGLCVYVNAGHTRPLLCRGKSGKVEVLNPTGTIVGPFADQKFRRESVLIGKDDILLLSTDGVTEAMSSSRREYSEKRLMKRLAALRRKTAKEIALGILDDVARFSSSGKYNDDRTLVAIKREG